MATVQNTYVGDGTTVLYSFTFPYISVQDVKVSVDDVSQGLLTEYILANATTVQFNTAPADGAQISIFRQTDTEDVKAVFFPGSAIRARDLNDNFTQNLYVTQEAIFGSDSATADAAAARQAADAASASATSAANDAAVAASDASASVAQSSAAVATANQASDDAGIAINTANSADTKATQALDAVLDVVPFDIVATVADIPTSPEDAERVRVTDATGIESFSPLTGLPSGFVGDSGISVEIAYSAPLSTWEYLSYTPIDPDDRYKAALDAFPSTGGTITGDVIVEGNLVSYGNDSRGSGEIILNCQFNSHAVSIQGPPHSAGADYTLTLPENTGTSGQVLATDGAGNTSWTTVVTDIDLDSYPALP